MGVLILISVLFIAGASAFSVSQTGDARHAAADVGGSAAATEFVVIPEGGTVWSAVIPFTPEGTAPHDWVGQVLAVNDVDPARVTAGAVIHLPPRASEG